SHRFGDLGARRSDSGRKPCACCRVVCGRGDDISHARNLGDVIRTSLHDSAGTIESVPEVANVMTEPSRAERMGGLGRVLIAVYIVLALAATFRSVYQIIAKFDEAPL